MPDVMIRNGVVKCRNKSGNFEVCQPLALYAGNAACGNCPLIEFAESYEMIKFAV